MPQEELDRQLLQEELDRRFNDLRALMDERRDNAVREIGLIQEELDRRLSNLDKLNVQRFEDLKELMLAGQGAARAAVEAALAAAKEAVAVAQTASEKRFDGVNEFRKTLADQTATFVPRPENDAKLESLSARVSANADRMAALELRLTSRLDLGEGADRGTTASHAEQRLNISQVIAALAVVVAVASIILLALKK
jgi:hypothetical protein